MKRFVLIGLLLIVFACEDKKGDDEKPEDTYGCEINLEGYCTVSYTHLTLPTKRIV